MKSRGKHLKRCIEEPGAEEVCLELLIECAECGEFVCEQCYLKHHAGHESEDEGEGLEVNENAMGLPLAVKVGARVRHPITHLEGSVIRIKAGGPLTRLIVEWDNNTASIHDLEELFPLPKHHH
jgi:hypothetical protein